MEDFKLAYKELAEERDYYQDDVVPYYEDNCMRAVKVSINAKEQII